MDASIDQTTAQRRATVTLPSDTTILITREFAAPRDLVWRAWTEPDLIARWWHADRGEVLSIDADVRVGGRWRYVMRANNGFEVAFNGEYRDVVANERLVTTEIYEPLPDEPALNTTTFAEHDGRTLVTLHVEHSTQRARDLHVNSGMEDGLQDALCLLDELAQTLIQ